MIHQGGFATPHRRRRILPYRGLARTGRVRRVVLCALAATALGLPAAGLPAALAGPALAQPTPGAPTPGGPGQGGPRGKQWYLDQIRIPEAHAVTRGDGVTIGMLTNGLPVGHPDLEGRVLPAMRLDRGLWDSAEEAPADYPMADPQATGEFGLMVARGGSGLLGVAPAARVRPMICPGLAEDTSFCVRWLVDSGVKVINLASWGSSAGSTPVDGIRYALSKNVVVVMALEEGARLPAAQRAGVLLVGGVGKDGKLQPTVRPDSRVTLRAPGTSAPFAGAGEIIGLDPEAADGSGYNTLGLFDGDQIAAAIVSGVVALVRAKYPDLGAASVIDRVLRTATDLGDPGKDSTYGHGVVDAFTAVTADVPAVSANPLGDPGPPDRRFPLAGVAIAVAAICLVVVAAALVGIFQVWRLRARRRSRTRSGQPGWR